MEVHSLKNNKLNSIKNNPFKKEKEIQTLVENHTELLFKFLKIPIDLSFLHLEQQVTQKELC